MRQIEDYEWLSTPQAQQRWRDLCNEISVNSASMLKRLRSTLTTNQASVLIEQLDLIALAKRKVSDPQQWFWTRQLLEQSSDQETASDTACDFPPQSRVIDVCCGAGADSVALANQRHSVTSIDRCPIACELTKHNAMSHGLNIEVFNREAGNSLDVPRDYIHIDPDRRADGSRSSSLDRLSPTWDTIAQLLKRCRGMSLKLAPGTRADLKGMARNKESIPESLRFLSKDGSVRQQRWYWGLERWPTDSITASMFLNTSSSRRAMQFFAAKHTIPPNANTSTSPGWFHETFSLDDMATSEDMAVTDKPLEFVADYDPSIRAAELSSSFAHRYGWQLIDSNSGYVTASKTLVHPMVRWFQVVDILPLDKRQIKSYVRESRVYAWELKSRGLEVDLTALRKILPCDSNSDETRTILCLKIGRQHRVVFCKEADCS